jgi:TonB family protein
MNPLLIYMIKAAICLAVFYIVYTIMLCRDTMYGRNRAFIMLSVVSALTLPCITIETNAPVGSVFFGKTLSEVLIAGTPGQTLSGSGRIFLNGWPDMLLMIYITGLIIFSLGFLVNIAELGLLIAKNRSAGSKIIRFHGLNTAGFSAVGYIFINSRLSETDAAEILKHEENHLAHHHFLDILFMEIVKVIQWFNPFIHFFDRSLRAVHEYQADEGCLSSGVPVLSYQQLLMNQVFKTRAFNITNSFSNPTLIKKRMIMMTKRRSKTLANLKLLMVLPVIAILLVTFSSCKGKTGPEENTTEVAPPPPPPPPPSPADAVNADQKVVAGEVVQKAKYIPPPPPPPPPPPFTVRDGDTTWYKVDVMPQFEGGEAALLKYIGDNTNYPETAKLNSIQGKVLIGFIVNTDGTVSNVRLERRVNPELDAEALRVVNSLPAFEKPGVNNGKPVAVWYNVPIVFKLK